MKKFECEQSANVVIWGGTVCGVTAAIAAIRTDPKVKVLWLVSTCMRSNFCQNPKFYII